MISLIVAVIAVYDIINILIQMIYSNSPYHFPTTSLLGVVL